MTLLKMTLWPFIDIPRSLHFVSRILLKKYYLKFLRGTFWLFKSKVAFLGCLDIFVKVAIGEWLLRTDPAFPQITK